MKYRELASIMRKVNFQKKPDIVGYAVITEESFTRHYTKEERTYQFSSNNKAFKAEMCGYSIFANSVDYNDCCRLEKYLKEEHGGPDGWGVDYCYILDDKGNEIRDYVEAIKYLGLEEE